MTPQDNRDLFAIADLADEFDISTRAIRFYESKGLIHPERVGGNLGEHRVGPLADFRARGQHTHPPLGRGFERDDRREMVLA